MRDRQINIDRETLRVAPCLELAVTWGREIRVGIERIWENVFDWEHLPVLHEMYFNAVELIEVGNWGWRVALTKNPGTPDRQMVLELRADRENARYRVQTLSGDGAGTEIWTLLTPAGPHRTAVEVRYYLPERHPQRLAALADKYRASCARLWDEDAAMMMRRDEIIARVARRSPGSRAAVSLGPSAELRRRLPLLVEFDGEPFRIVEGEDGRLLAHATICPHWLGPLDAAAQQNGILRCPWHGYCFDMRTGESTDGRGYRLAPAPRVAVDPVTGEASLVPCGRPILGNSTVNSPSSGRKAQI
jgi:nitrite reductase/ring-hydroxylating ferredoxin subunit